MRLRTIKEAIEAGSKQKVFVYGTLMNPETRQKALGEEIDAYPAKIEGEIKEDENYSTIVQGKGEVEGQVMELTPEQIKKLDIWESEYIRHEVVLTTGESAWAYSRKEKFDSQGKVKETQVSKIKTGKTYTVVSEFGGLGCNHKAGSEVKVEYVRSGATKYRIKFVGDPVYNDYDSDDSLPII